MEAAIVLPIIIIAVITVVLIIMFFYCQMSERSRLHIALRNEAGIMTEHTLYEDFPDVLGECDVSMKDPKPASGGQIYASKQLFMKHKGLLAEQGKFIIQGSSYAADGTGYVRLCVLVKGIGKNDKQ